MFRASLVFIACWLATGTVDGQVTSPVESRNQLIAKGLEFLDVGKFDEALSACGPWSDEMEEEVLRRLKEATTQKDRSAMAKWFRVYFDYYPFGYLHWNSSHAQWNQTSLEFVEFLRTAPQELRAKHQDDIAAASLYAKLVAAYDKRSNDQGRYYAETIINKHPRSMFAAASVLSVADHCESSTFASVTARMVYEKYLARLKEAGSPIRYQIWVMYAYASEHEKPEACAGLVPAREGC